MVEMIKYCYTFDYHSVVKFTTSKGTSNLLSTDLKRLSVKMLQIGNDFVKVGGLKALIFAGTNFRENLAIAPHYLDSY